MDVTEPLLFIGIGLVIFFLGLLAGYLAMKTWFRHRSPKVAEKGEANRISLSALTRREGDS
jgi:protein-S-isoprenylcysteine O-methyltransferase Ste14